MFQGARVPKCLRSRAWWYRAKIRCLKSAIRSLQVLSPPIPRQQRQSGSRSLFKSKFYNLLAVWSWGNHFTPVKSIHFNCKRGMIVISTSYNYCENNNSHYDYYNKNSVWYIAANNWWTSLLLCLDIVHPDGNESWKWGPEPCFSVQPTNKRWNFLIILTSWLHSHLEYSLEIFWKTW